MCFNRSVAMPADNPVVSCAGLTKRFGDRVAVDAVDLSLGSGEVFALLGPNGAGKTTTVRMLCGLITPTAGSVSIKGQKLVPSEESFRRHIGILTEHPGLYERLTLLANLEFFARLVGLSAQKFAVRAEELLRRFDLWERRDERVSSFSKGMKQKAAIVRALLHDPLVVFLDEPTSGLDPEAALDVRETIVALKKQARTVLLTTHRLSEAEELADRVGIIKTRLLAVDSVKNLRGRLYGRRLAVTVGKCEDELVARVMALPFVKEVERSDSQLLVSLHDLDRDTPELVRALVAAGAAIYEVAEVKQSLEAVYLHLLGKEAGS